MPTESENAVDSLVNRFSNPSLPHQVSVPSSETEVSYIDAVGMCGVFGYEAEVNHTIGLCKNARIDFHLLRTVTQTGTQRYKQRKKHRIQYACLSGNLKWFSTLFKEMNTIDIVMLRNQYNETLYHLVNDTRIDPRINDRLHILNVLTTTDLEFNEQVVQSAFDLISSNDLFTTHGHEQLLSWWLDQLDRLNPRNRNCYLPWLACNNRLKAVQQLCRMESTDLNFETMHGHTALTLACSQGHTDVVDELLRYYPHRLSNLNHEKGGTALYWACRYNHIGIVKKLCSIPEIDIHLESTYGYTPWVIACAEGHTAVIDILLQYYPQRLRDINHHLIYGQTALYLASEKNHIDIVTKLCRIPEMNLDITDGYLDTPLMIACLEGHKAIVEILLQYYPQRLRGINHKNSYGQTALYWACRYNHIDIVKKLCSIPEIDINLQDSFERTPLIVAYSEGHIPIVDVLLQYYPQRLRNTNHQNKFGQTDLYWACRNNVIDIITKLCRIPEIDLNITAPNGKTLLEIIFEKPDHVILNEVLRYATRLNLNQPFNASNETLLYKACANNRIEIVQRICWIDTTDLNVSTLPEGDTPLVCAVDKGLFAIVDILLQYAPGRLRVNQQTKNGTTALMTAVRNKYTSIVQLLCRIPGIDIDLRDTDGNTAISLAFSEEYSAILSKLREGR